MNNPSDADLEPLIATVAEAIGLNTAAPTVDAIIKTDGAAGEETRKVMAADLPAACFALERRWAALNAGAEAGVAKAFAPIAATRLAQLLGTAGAENAVTSSALLQAAALADDGFLPIDTLAAWWIKADWFLTIETFLAAHFRKHVLIEQHQATVRYRLPASNTSKESAAEEGAVTTVSADVAANAQQATMPAVVIAPAGVSAGASMCVTTPSGALIDVARPADVADGTAFEVAIATEHMVAPRVSEEEMPSSIAQIFGMLESHKSELAVLEYSGAFGRLARSLGVSLSRRVSCARAAAGSATYSIHSDHPATLVQSVRRRSSRSSCASHSSRSTCRRSASSRKRSRTESPVDRKRSKLFICARNVVL